MSESESDFAARVVAANDIVDVIGAYLTLRPTASGFVCLCPFHEGRDPSLVIDEEAQRFACRTCGKGGDVLEFVRDIERVPLADAVASLARRAGIAPEPNRDLAADLAICDAATPGPWHYDDGITDDLCDPPERGKPTSIECLIPGKGQVLIGDVVSGEGAPCFVGESEADANGRMMAAAREGWPAALREIDRLRAEKKQRLDDYGFLEAWLQKARRDHEGRLDIDGTMQDAQNDWAMRCLTAEAEAERLRAMHAAACDRIAQQSDALSRTAEGRAVALLGKLRRLGAMRHTGPVAFEYEGADGTTDRYSFHPMRLFHQHADPATGREARWMFEGYDAGQMRGLPRTFAVGRMTLDPETKGGT